MPKVWTYDATCAAVGPRVAASLTALRIADSLRAMMPRSIAQELAPILLLTVTACGPSTPSTNSTPEAEPTTAASAEPAASAAASAAPTAEAKPEPPARKAYDLAEHGVPFSLELSPKATFKKLSEAMGKAGFKGVIVYDDDPKVAIGVSTVPAKLRTLAQMKADEKAAFGATFLKEETDLLVFDKTNGGAKKELGFVVRLEVDKVVYRCTSYLSSGFGLGVENEADTVEKLEASIAACRSLKPNK